MRVFSIYILYAQVFTRPLFLFVSMPLILLNCSVAPRLDCATLASCPQYLHCTQLPRPFILPILCPDSIARHSHYRFPYPLRPRQRIIGLHGRCPCYCTFISLYHNTNLAKAEILLTGHCEKIGVRDVGFTADLRNHKWCCNL